MSLILDSLTDSMKTAMKAGDKARLSAVRMLISSIKYALVDTPDLSEEKIIELLRKESKKRRESVEAYRSGGREELAMQEEYEVGVIAEYLPSQMSEDEVRVIVEKMLNGKGLTMTNIGEAMKLVLPELKGKADGGMVSKVVREILSK